MTPQTPGELEMQKLRQGGFSDADVQSWQTRQSQRLTQGGFSNLEIDNYFGKKDIDESPIKDFFTKSLPGFFTHDYTPSPDAFDLSHPITSTEKLAGPDVTQGVEAGLQSSVSGLALRGKAPDVQAPASFKGRMASDVGQLAGDLPVMGVGAAIGGFGTSEFGPIAAAAGTGAGAFALPEGLRTAMMEAYTKGQVRSASDFIGRVKDVTLASVKSGAVGALTSLSGEVAAPFLAPGIIRTAGKAAVEAGTLTTSQSLIQKGQLPEPQDFEDAGILLFGLHAAGFGATKLRNIYAQTGVTPSQIWNDARSDPALKEELAATNVAVPERYVQPPAVPLTEKPSAIPAEKAPPSPQVAATEASASAPAPAAIPARARTGGRVARPLDILQFVASIGGISADDANIGDLKAMDADKLTIPGFRKLVQKSGGLQLDHAREIAEESGYLHPNSDVNDLLNSIDNAMRGGEEFSSHDLDQYTRWKAQDAARRARDEEANHEPVSQIQELQDRASKLGIETHESWTAEDLLASIIEREAMRADASESHHAAIELDMDRYIENQYPHLAERLKNSGFDSEIPFFGSEPEATPGTETVGGEHGIGAERTAGNVAPEPSAGSPLELTAEAGGQTVIPGAEQSARQLSAARESAGHGRKATGVNQKEADQGLFAPPVEEPTLLRRMLGSEEGSLQLAAPRSPAEQAVLDRIAEHPTKTRPMTLDRLYIDTVDDLYAVRAMEKALAGNVPLRTEESPYQMMRLFRGTAGRVEQFLERAAFRFSDLMTVGKSLKEILKPTKHDLDGLRAYLVSRRAVELEGRGVETGVPLTDAQAVIAAGDPKYATIAQELQDYQRNLMQYLVESGVVSRKTSLQMATANQEYVPFYRLFTEDEGKGGAPGASGKVRNPVKQIKGSEREILDPLESIVRNTETYIKIAEKNRTNSTLVKFAGQFALGSDFVEKVPNAIVPIELSDSELRAFVDQNSLAGDPAAFTVFRPRAFQPSPDEIAVWKDGKRSVYRVNRDLADAVDKMDPQILPWYARMLALAARGLRAGATLTPDFIMRNLMRDQLTANSLARYRYIPFYDAIKGLGSILKKDDDYQSWLKAGGANGAMVSLDRRYMEHNVFGIAKETGFLKRTINVVTTPFEMLRIVSEIAENATRVGAFKRAYRETKQPFTAAFESRDITLDFARIGAQMRAANAIVAFMNAGVQGVDRTIRAFKENPAGTLARTIAAITVPSVLLWLHNRDDPRWKAIPNWEKDLFWIIMTKDHIYRIPKPFELGIVFGTLPERVLDHFYQNQPSSKMFGDLAGDVQNGLMPNYIPTIALPFLEAFANRSMFSGQKMIPSGMEQVMPEYQYTDYTTETAKRIGHFIALMPGMKQNQFASPILLENYVRDWGGGMGSYMLQASDYSLRKAGIIHPPPAPSPTLADNPFVKAFAVRYPSASAQPLQDFWERYGQAQATITTIQALSKRGEPAAAVQEMKLAQQSGTIVRMQSIEQGLTNIRNEIHLITIDPSMKPEEKRQMIDGLYLTMIRAAEQGNTLADQIDAAVATRH